MISPIMTAPLVDIYSTHASTGGGTKVNGIDEQRQFLFN